MVCSHPALRLRPEIILSAPVNANTPSADRTDALPPSAPSHLSRARLLKRVFEIDLEHCLQCGGPLTIIAAIEDPPVIAKILTHLGWSARAPPRAPALRPWFIKEVKDAYAILIVGDSMKSAFDAGDLAIVNPRLARMRNQDAIFVTGEH